MSKDCYTPPTLSGVQVDATILRSIVQGSATAVVQTINGPVPSAAKRLAEAAAKINYTTKADLGELRNYMRDVGVGLVYVLGDALAGDGGGGVFSYDINDTTTADDGVSIIVGGDGARWRRFINRRTGIRFAALAEAQGAALAGIVAPDEMVEVLGKASVGDGGSFVGIVQVADDPLNPGGGRIRPNAREVRPEMWGAIGDGNADDSIAFRAAAAFLGANGGGAILGRYGATYRLATPENLTDAPNVLGYIVDLPSGVCAIGNGARLTGRGSGIGYTAFSIRANSDIDVKGWDIVGDGITDNVNAGLACCVCIRWKESSSDQTAENIRILSNTATDCYFGGVLAQRIDLDPGKLDGMVRNLWIEDNIFDGSGYGSHMIGLNGCTDFRVANNTLNNWGGKAIDVSASCQRGTVSGNSGLTAVNGQGCLKVEQHIQSGLAQTEQIAVFGNNFRRTGGRDTVDAAVARFVGQNVSITGNSFIGFEGTMLEVALASGADVVPELILRIRGNTFVSGGVDADGNPGRTWEIFSNFLLGSGPMTGWDQVLIEGNSFSGATAGGHGNIRASGVSVIGNTFKNCASYVCRVWNDSGITYDQNDTYDYIRFDGNTVIDCIGGLFIDDRDTSAIGTGSKHVSTTGNHFRGDVPVPILIQGGEHVVEGNNIIAKPASGGHGVVLTRCRYVNAGQGDIIECAAAASRWPYLITQCDHWLIGGFVAKGGANPFYSVQTPTQGTLTHFVSDGALSAEPNSPDPSRTVVVAPEAVEE